MIHFCINSVYFVLLGEMLFQVEALGKESDTNADEDVFDEEELSKSDAVETAERHSVGHTKLHVVNWLET